MRDQESRSHWIDSAVLPRQQDGSWKIDRLQSTSVNVEGAMTEDEGYRKAGRKRT